MSNSVCLIGPAFSITGETIFHSNEVAFQLSFNSESDQEEVLAFEWFLDGYAILVQNLIEFSGTVSDGVHKIGARILSSGGWSGVKYLSFTCSHLISETIEGPDTINRADTGTYLAIATYSDGSTVDETADFTFSCPEGSFSGGVFTPTLNDLPTLTTVIIASRTGGNPLEKEVTITTRVATTTIEGPSTLLINTSGTYTIIETFTDGTAPADVTNLYTLSSDQGGFEGNVFTPTVENAVSVISATRIGFNTLYKEIGLYWVISDTIEGPDSVAQGSTATFEVQENYSDGTSAFVTGNYTFSSTDGTFDSNVFTPTLNDQPTHDTLISASTPGQDALTKEITIITRVTDIAIDGPDSLVIGNTGTYTVIETFTDGSTTDVTDLYAFSSPQGTFNANIFTPESSGTAIISAEREGFNTLQKDVTVIADVTSITIEGPTNITQHDTPSYTVIETLSDGSTIDVTSQYTFSCPGGIFDGNVFTPTIDDELDKFPTMTATKPGASPVTKGIFILTRIAGTTISGEHDKVYNHQLYPWTVSYTYNDGTPVSDQTSNYTFSCPDGTFSGNILRANAGGDLSGPTKASSVAFNRPGNYDSGTIPITIYLVTGGSLNGPDTIAQGASAAYTVTMSYSDETQHDATSECVFSVIQSGEGTFSNNVLTALETGEPDHEVEIYSTGAPGTGWFGIETPITITNPSGDSGKSN